MPVRFSDYNILVLRCVVYNWTVFIPSIALADSRKYLCVFYCWFSPDYAFHFYSSPLSSFLYLISWTGFLTRVLGTSNFRFYCYWYCLPRRLVNLRMVAITTLAPRPHNGTNKSVQQTKGRVYPRRACLSGVIQYGRKPQVRRSSRGQNRPLIGLKHDQA